MNWEQFLPTSIQLPGDQLLYRIVYCQSYLILRHCWKRQWYRFSSLPRLKMRRHQTSPKFMRLMSSKSYCSMPDKLSGLMCGLSEVLSLLFRPLNRQSKWSVNSQISSCSPTIIAGMFGMLVLFSFPPSSTVVWPLPVAVKIITAPEQHSRRAGLFPSSITNILSFFHFLRNTSPGVQIQTVRFVTDIHLYCLFWSSSEASNGQTKPQKCFLIWQEL